MLLKKGVLTGILACLLSFTASVSYAETPIHYLPDSFEVTGTRIHQQASETGRQIHVIDGKKLADMPGTSIDDKLRYLPGVEVQSRNSFGIVPNFSIRGSTFNQVLVLVDGQRLNDPLTGHFNGHIPVTEEEIARIEVIHGPSAAVYGPDAVGGVINVITKTYDVPHNKSETSAGASLTAGEHNLISAKGGFFNQTGNLHYSGGIESRHSDGHAIDENRNADFGINTFSASVGYELNDKWYISARSGYDQRNFSAINFYTNSSIDSSRETVTQLWNHLALQRNDGNSRSNIEVSINQSTDEFAFQEQAPVNEHTMQRGEIHANHLIQVLPELALQGGVQADYQQIESSDRGDHTKIRPGAYLNTLYRPVSELNINLSARGDYDENFGLEFSPQLSASYRLNRFTFRGLAGRSVRAPDYTERFVSYNLPALQEGRNLGNPDLKAEKAWNYEAGADYRFNSLINFSVTGFMRDGTDLIDYVFINEADIHLENGPELEPGAAYNFAQNIANLRTTGIEFSVKGSYQLTDNAGISYESGVTLLESTSPGEDDEEVLTKYIAGHGDLLQQNSLQFSFGNFTLGANSLFKSRNDGAEEYSGNLDVTMEPSYLIINSRAGYNFDFAPIGVHFEVSNITDVTHHDIMGARMPGRWMKGGISYKY